jgi:hypothetical protein
MSIALGSCVISTTGNVVTIGTTVGAEISGVGTNVPNGNSVGKKAGCELGSGNWLVGTLGVGNPVFTFVGLEDNGVVVGINDEVALGCGVSVMTGFDNGTEVGCLVTVVLGNSVIVGTRVGVVPFADGTGVDITGNSLGVMKGSEEGFASVVVLGFVDG